MVGWRAWKHEELFSWRVVASLRKVMKRRKEEEKNPTAKNQQGVSKNATKEHRKCCAKIMAVSGEVVRPGT